MTAVYIFIGFVLGWITGIVVSFYWLKSILASIPDPEDLDIEEVI